MKPHRLLTLIAVAALYSCQTYIPNLAVDPSFTYRAMTDTGMVIGGVSSDLEDLGDKRADRYAGELKTAIESKRPDLVVVDAPSLRNKMGSSTYQAMMDEWTAGLRISQPSITSIKKAVPNARYASFARVEQTSTRVSNTESPYYEKKQQAGVSHSLAAVREMKVTFTVYDLTSGTEVWNGVAPISETETRHQLHRFGGPTTYTLEYPDFPTEQEAFARAGRGFAENLPEDE